MNINVSEAKAHLGRYVESAAQGAHFIICGRNRPLAELRPLTGGAASGTPLRLGVLRGQFSVPPDFNLPLEDFERDYYGDKAE